MEVTGAVRRLGGLYVVPLVTIDTSVKKAIVDVGKIPPHIYRHTTIIGYFEGSETRCCAGIGISTANPTSAIVRD